MLTPKFMYSGKINLDELRKLKQMIHNLDGKVIECKDEQFVGACSHIICFNFFASVKIMGGLVSGKWLVTKEYITSSHNAGKWLSEEPFEVKDHKELARFMRLKKGKIYEGSIFFIQASDRQLTRKLTSVLVAGGAVVLSKEDIVNEKMNVDKAFSDEESLESVKSIVGVHTPILKLEYIKKTIFFKHDINNFKKYLYNSETAEFNRLSLSEMLTKQMAARLDSPLLQRVRRRRNIVIQSNKISNYFPLWKENDFKSPLQRSNGSVDDDDDDDIQVLTVKKLKKDPQEVPKDKLPNIDSENHVRDNSNKISSKTFESKSLQQGKKLQQADVNNVAKDSRRSIFQSNIEKLKETKGAVIPVDFDKIIRLSSDFIVDLNTSVFYLNSYFLKSYEYPSLKRKVIELNVNESNYLDGVCHDDLRVVTKRFGRRNMNVLEKVTRAEPRELDDLYINAICLDWMKLRVQPDIVPNAEALGAMVRSILTVSNPDVSNKALNIFGSILNLHPPRNTKMRDYYLNVFCKSNPNSETNSFSKGWHFISFIARDLLKSNSSSCDEIMLFNHTLHLLHLDLVCYNKSPVTISTLMCYRLFWVGVNQNPSIVNGDVKDLFQLWILSLRSRSSVRRKITQLVSIFLEMVWKWSEISNPFLLTRWPYPSTMLAVADEICHQFKDVSASDTVKLLDFVGVPWQRMMLAFLGFRAKNSRSLPPQITCKSLRDLLYQEVSACSKHTSNEDTFPHPIRVQLCVFFLTSYSHMTGLKHCKQNLIREMVHSLNRKEVVNCSKECVSESVSTSESGVRRSSSSSGMDEEEEVSPIAKELGREIMNCFGVLPRVKSHILGLEGRCAHISCSSFVQAL